LCIQCGNENLEKVEYGEPDRDPSPVDELDTLPALKSGAVSLISVTIYVSADLSFLSPVDIGDRVTAVRVVTEDVFPSNQRTGVLGLPTGSRAKPRVRTAVGGEMRRPSLASAR